MNNRIRIEHLNARGRTIKKMTYLTSQPWDRSNPMATHAFAILEQVWLLNEGDRISIFCNDEPADGLDT